MNASPLVMGSVQMALMLAAALVGGQVMRRLRQPAVVGEILGGILLGPTLLGAVAPGLWTQVFAASPEAETSRQFLTTLGMALFLFVAGLETRGEAAGSLGRQAVVVGLAGTVLPLAAGAGLVAAAPALFWQDGPPAHHLAVALFVGMNLANSANPVLARILMDLGLLRTPVGAMAMAATVVDDLLNWLLFAAVLGAGASGGGLEAMAGRLLLVVLVLAGIVGSGRWLGPKVLPWLRRSLPWPSGFITVTAVVVLATASLTEALGLHAFLGPFLAGVAVGGSDARHREAHEAATHFALGFCAPLYFVAMGMTTDFAAHLDLWLVVVLTAVAVASKTGGVLAGARLAGLPLGRVPVAVAVALNARGATGMVLAGVGRSAGLVDERLFVALVAMAMVTTLLAGPAVRGVLPREAVSDRLRA